ncbi:MAG TPA: hypothetical protein VEI74_12975 [Candidatus Methylomirabilis sp.]|nr:hypothetical protein [Candidatus Methylomirabilis sp.]
MAEATSAARNKAIERDPRPFSCQMIDCSPPVFLDFERFFPAPVIYQWRTLRFAGHVVG